MSFINKRIYMPLTWGLTVAILGGAATHLDAWYHALKEPFWKPPDWAFGPMWSIIFICAGIAWVSLKLHNSDPKVLSRIKILFWLNSFFNILWSVLYFRFERPDWSLYESFFLWLSVFLMWFYIHKHSPRSSVWMWPYLIWVSIAIALNWDTVRLNGPFQ